MAKTGKIRGQAAAWQLLLSNDPRATWFTDSHLSRMAKCSRKTAYNHITAWLADGRVEAKPSKTGWKRQVRRIVANRRTESEATDGAEPEMEVVNEVDPYINAVRQHGDTFISILVALRDDENVEARVRFSAAACLSEFNCAVPGSEVVAPVESERVKEVRAAIQFVNETTSDEYHALVEELSREVLAQFGSVELDRVIKSSICGGQP